MKKEYRIFLLALILIIFNIHVCSADPNTYDCKNFKNMISQFQEYSIVPDGGEFHTSPDYSKAYANINKSTSYKITDSVKNFALSMTVSWDSASDIPNIANAGCGLLFRFNDSTYITSILRMDGNLTASGVKTGKGMFTKKYYYGHANIEATHNLTVVANNDNVKIYIDGKQYANIMDVSITRSGDLRLITVSGTNKDWGTRCKFKNINYYTW